MSLINLSAIDHGCCGKGLCDKHYASLQEGRPSPERVAELREVGALLAVNGLDPALSLNLAAEYEVSATDRYEVLAGWKLQHAHSAVAQKFG